MPTKCRQAAKQLTGEEIIVCLGKVGGASKNEEALCREGCRRRVESPSGGGIIPCHTGDSGTPTQPRGVPKIQITLIVPQRGELGKRQVGWKRRGPFHLQQDQPISWAE